MQKLPLSLYCAVAFSAVVGFLFDVMTIKNETGNFTPQFLLITVLWDISGNMH